MIKSLTATMLAALLAGTMLTAAVIQASESAAQQSVRLGTPDKVD